MKIFDNLIDNLWDGNMCPSEEYGKSEKSKAIFADIILCENELEHFISQDGKGLFEKYQQLHNDFCIETEYLAFRAGYRFGIQLLMSGLDN